MAVRELVILGVGGTCVDLLETIELLNAAAGRPVYRVRGFLDDNPAQHGQLFAGVPVLGPVRAASEYAGAAFINMVGSPRTHKLKPEVIARSGIRPGDFVSIVHPSARVSRLAHVGIGTVIFQNVVIQAHAHVGCHVVVLANTVVNHDCVIGDYSCLASSVSLAGGVQVGSCCYLGMGCLVRNGVRLGDRSLVGMGGVVIRDVPADQVVAGNPARPLE